MKNTLTLSFLITLLSYGFVNAQTKRIEIGILGGASIATLRGNDTVEQNFNSRIGYSVGATIQYNFNKVFSINSGLSLERKGGRYESGIISKVGDTEGELKIVSNSDYLIVPLTVKANFGNKLNYFFNAGPYIGFLIKSSYHYKVGNETYRKEDDSEYYKNNDFGLATSVGISYPLNQKISMLAEARNNLGLYNTSKLKVANDGSIKNNSFLLNLGLKYKI